MKYIKTYENKQDEYKQEKGIYWMINIKSPHFNIMLWKIGADENFFDFLRFGNIEYAYILKTYFEDGSIGWGYNYIETMIENLEKYYTNYEYLGEVEITQDDIDTYETIKSAKNYNL